ncbi:MAG: HNH endonuclease [Pyrinomonadaceae bacterium]
MEKSDTIAEVCNALSENGRDKAIAILQGHYPFAPEAVSKRRYGPLASTGVFVRDGFIDRYSGDRLIFPPVLRVLSSALPEAFPYHPNWKTDVTHPAYWEIAATVDHLVPVTRGGTDAESNLITTSMAHNFAKMNWSLAELGWHLCPAGDLRVWDGLIHWFVDYATKNAAAIDNSSTRQWLRAARATLSVPSTDIQN